MKKKIILATILTVGIGLTGLLAQTDKIIETLTDIDGNIYKTIKIDTQVWMAENLKTTRYQNGDSISTTFPVNLDISDETTPKYQWAYNGNDSLVAIYGRLYTWYTVTDSRNVCPIGWHIPNDIEWNTLIDNLGGEIAARGKLKETGTIHWKSPNADATNESGFSALPGGHKWKNEFVYMGELTHWWSVSEWSQDRDFAWRRLLKYEDKEYPCCYTYKHIGFSARCIKD